MDRTAPEDWSLTQNFYEQRSKLISREKEQRSDHSFQQALSPTAQQACTIVSHIRTSEHASIWSRTPSHIASDPALEAEELYPGMIFNSAKNHMETTQLWKIVQKMPKGAILHCHLGAMVDMEWVFNEAIETEGMVVLSDVPLVDEKAREKADVSVVFSKTCDEDAPSIWSDEYRPLSKVPLMTAAESYPDGGRAGFLLWIQNRTTIPQSEMVKNHLGVDDIWNKLQSAFALSSPVIFYEPITRKFLRKFFKTACEDGVRWIEMRGITRRFKLEGHDEFVENRIAQARVIKEEIESFMASEEGKGFRGCRLIWDSLRNFTDEAIMEDMQICIEAKKLYPTLISGYDLVGPEDFGRTLHSLTPILLWFQTQCAIESVNIPFFLHAGETIGDGDSTDQNLYDAILLNSRRLGHAFSLYKHPLLIDMVKEKHIMVECCPISNEVLRYTASIKMHPLPALLARGVKAALSNDDPAMMGQGTSGLSHDFWQALQGWENLGLAGLGSLAQNSVRHAAFEDQTDDEWFKDVSEGIKGSGIRAQRIKEWNAEWEQFCEWIVQEFGNAK